MKKKTTDAAPQVPPALALRIKTIIKQHAPGIFEREPASAFHEPAVDALVTKLIELI